MRQVRNYQSDTLFWFQEEVWFCSKKSNHTEYIEEDRKVEQRAKEQVTLLGWNKQEILNWESIFWKCVFYKAHSITTTIRMFKYGLQRGAFTLIKSSV